MSLSRTAITDFATATPRWPRSSRRGSSGSSLDRRPSLASGAVSGSLVFSGSRRPSMQTVSFVQMADGTREDYELLDRYAEEHDSALTDRVLAALGALEGSFGGYKVTRLEHSLQS